MKNGAPIISLLLAIFVGVGIGRSDDLWKGKPEPEWKASLGAPIPFQAAQPEWKGRAEAETVPHRPAAVIDVEWLFKSRQSEKHDPTWKPSGTPKILPGNSNPLPANLLAETASDTDEILLISGNGSTIIPPLAPDEIPINPTQPKTESRSQLPEPTPVKPTEQSAWPSIPAKTLPQVPGTSGMPAKLGKPTPQVRENLPSGSPNISMMQDGPFGGVFVGLLDDVRNSSRFSARAEFMQAWVSNYHVPSLASTGTTTSRGVLGQPGSVSLLEGNLGEASRQGAKFSGLFWFDDEWRWAVEGNFFFLGRSHFAYNVNGAALGVLSRPVFSVNNQSEAVESVAQPGVVNGSMRVTAGSSMSGFEGNIRRMLWGDAKSGIAAVFGFRSVQLLDDLNIREYFTSVGSSTITPGTQVSVQDTFSTRNTFSGGQFGFHYQQHWDRFFIESRVMMGIGETFQSLDIGGSQIRQFAGQPTQVINSGLLASTSNIGHFKRDRFSVMPSVQLNLGYEITPRWKVYAGYQFLAWTGVARAGEQIDRSVDLTRIPNAPSGIAATSQSRPTVIWHDSSVTVHTISLGMEWMW